MVGPWSQIERLKLNKILLFSRKEFQVFKNVSFDPRAIAYFVMTQTQDCLYRSKVLLFGHIYLQRKPVFGNRKYN